MSHSVIGWQASACLRWYIFVFLLSSSPSFPLPKSLIQALCPVLSLFKPSAISGSQSLNSILSEPRANKMNIKRNINVWAMHFWHLQLESLFYLRLRLFWTQNFFFFPQRWCGDNVKVPQWSQASEPCSSQHCCCHTCCHTLFTVHLWASSMQKGKACCKHFKNDIQDACNKTETQGAKKSNNFPSSLFICVHEDEKKSTVFSQPAVIEIAGVT